LHRPFILRGLFVVVLGVHAFYASHRREAVNQALLDALDRDRLEELRFRCLGQRE
jgi:hypothetical protein